jgi:hypothetical protein
MVQEVNKIIYNMLISGRGVELPGIGVLFIERQAARKIAEDRVLSPRNVVIFSQSEQAPSLVDEIVAIAKCQREQAEDIYERWKSKTYVDGKLTIGGVGMLTGSSFSSEKSFSSAINPQGVKTIVIRKRTSHMWLYVVSAVAVVVALAFLGYIIWGQGAEPKRVETKPAAVVAPPHCIPAVPTTKNIKEKAAAAPPPGMRIKSVRRLVIGEITRLVTRLNAMQITRNTS